MPRGDARITLPPPGFSTLVTSAFNWARYSVANGPAMTWLKSSPRRPVSGLTPEIGAVFLPRRVSVMIGDSVENIRPAVYAVSELLSGSAVRNRNQVKSGAGAIGVIAAVFYWEVRQNVHGNERQKTQGLKSPNKWRRLSLCCHCGWRSGRHAHLANAGPA